MIIFGILTETSIARLLIAGIIPGIVATFVFIAGITLRCLAQSIPGSALSWGDFLDCAAQGAAQNLGDFILVLCRHRIDLSRPGDPHGGRRFRGLWHVGFGNCPQKTGLE